MPETDWILMGILLVAGHGLADYALQGDYMAKTKDHTNPNNKGIWFHSLFAHSWIHGGFVAVITGLWWLGVLEAAIHGFTDWLKCDRRITFVTDQYVHYACKLAWLTIAFFCAP